MICKNALPCCPQRLQGEHLRVLLQGGLYHLLDAVLGAKILEPSSMMADFPRAPELFDLISVRQKHWCATFRSKLVRHTEAPTPLRSIMSAG